MHVAISPGVLTFKDLHINPQKVTEGLALEPIRYSRVGGYELGDTSELAKSLPTTVKKYFGMEVTADRNVR